MQKKEAIEIKPTETQRVRTTLNLRKTDVDGISKFAAERGATQTAIMDTVLDIALAELRNTKKIDQMLKDTNGFIFERDLAVVQRFLPPEEVKPLSAFQKAYLWFKLKDQKDRERVFDALGLTEEINEINVVSAILENASIFKDGIHVGYSTPKLANEMRAKLSPIQMEFLNLKIGNEAFAKLKEKRPDLFPEVNVFAAADDATALPLEPETVVDDQD